MMSKFVLTIMLSLITLTVMTPLSLAQNSPQDYLQAHNNARANVGVDPIQWDDTLTTYAQNYVNQLSGSCSLIHSNGPYGENLAGSGTDFTATAAVEMWINEEQFYDYNQNMCVGGECLHYTQVVWRNSVRLGCAKARCNNGGTVISCNYDPRGNFNDERPY